MGGGTCHNGGRVCVVAGAVPTVVPVCVGSYGGGDRMD